jgi:hypothetical protein
VLGFSTLLSLLAVSHVQAGLLIIDTLIMHSMPQLGAALWHCQLVDHPA